MKKKSSKEHQNAILKFFLVRVHLECFQGWIHVEWLKKVKKDIIAIISGIRFCLKKFRCTLNLFQSTYMVFGKCLLTSGRFFCHCRWFLARYHIQSLFLSPPFYLYVCWHPFLEYLLLDFCYRHTYVFLF